MYIFVVGADIGTGDVSIMLRKRCCCCSAALIITIKVIINAYALMTEEAESYDPTFHQPRQNGVNRGFNCFQSLKMDNFIAGIPLQE
jgi:hypothetical protein